MVTINNIEDCKRIVIKVGSSLVTGSSNNIDNKFLDSISSDIKYLHDQNKEVIIVSSGAVALGNINKNKKKLSLSESQAASSVGQIKLINGWESALKNKGIEIAQILITAEGASVRSRRRASSATRMQHSRESVFRHLETEVLSIF